MESENLEFFTVPIPKSKVLGTISALDDIINQKFGRSFYREMGGDIGIWIESVDYDIGEIDLQIAVIRIKEFDTIPGIFTKLSLEPILSGYSNTLFIFWDFIIWAFKELLLDGFITKEEIIDSKVLDVIKPPFLTNAEREILELIISGLTNDAIIDIRKINIRTLKNQINKLRKLYGVTELGQKGRQELIRKAKENNL